MVWRHGAVVAEGLMVDFLKLEPAAWFEVTVETVLENAIVLSTKHREFYAGSSISAGLRCCESMWLALYHVAVFIQPSVMGSDVA